MAGEGGGAGGWAGGLSGLIDAVKGSRPPTTSYQKRLSWWQSLGNEHSRPPTGGYHVVAAQPASAFSNVSGVTPEAPASPWNPLPVFGGGSLGFFDSVPGSQFSPSQGQGTRTGQQPPRVPTWEDGLQAVAELGLDIWLRLRSSRLARDAARAAQRAFDARWRAILGGVGQVQFPAGGVVRPAITGGVAVPDLLQFSGSGGIGSLYGGQEFGQTGWGSVISGLGSAAGSIISAFTQQDQNVLAPYGDPWGPNILYSGQERANAAINASLAGGCGSPFVAGGSALRPSTFSMLNPATGKATWFRPAGRPVLWSSDLSACRRVRKIAGKARRRVGGR